MLRLVEACAKSAAVVVRLVTILALVAAAGGCAVYKDGMPKVPAPIVGSVETYGTSQIDCMSNALRPFKSTTFKVAVAKIPNKMPQQVGDMLLPGDMNEMVMQSLGRFTNVFDLYALGDPTGMPPFDPKEVAGLSDTMAMLALEGKVEPDIIIRGALYSARVGPHVASGLDGLIGFNQKTQSFEANLQLMAVGARSRLVLVAPVSLQVNIFAATQGASVFVVSSSNYTSGEQTFQFTAPTAYGLQLLSDYAVANLMGNIASANFPVSFAVCRSLAINGQVAHVPDKDPKSPPSQAVGVTVYKQNDQYCADFQSQALAVVGGQSVKVKITQYRGSHIPVSIKSDIVPAGTTGICLDRSDVSPQKNAMEVSYETLDGKVLGSGYLND